MKLTVSAFTFVLTSGFCSAQTVSENWLKQVGVTCGGGISEESRQEVESKVRESLGAISESDASVYKAEDIRNLLSAFSEDGKGDAYSQYVNCIVSVIDVAARSASETEGTDLSKIELDAPPPPTEIKIVSGDANLTVSPGDFFGLKNEDLMFFIQDIGERSDKSILYFEYTDIESNNNYSGIATEGQIIDPRRDCKVIPYRIDASSKTASIKVKC